MEISPNYNFTCFFSTEFQNSASFNVSKHKLEIIREGYENVDEGKAGKGHLADRSGLANQHLIWFNPDF